MARKIEEIDVTDLEQVVSIAEEVRRTGEPKLLRRQGEDLALVVPTTTPRGRVGRPLTESDPLLDLIGIGRSEIPGGISSRKDQALLIAKRSRTTE